MAPSPNSSLPHPKRKPYTYTSCLCVAVKRTDACAPRRTSPWLAVVALVRIRRHGLAWELRGGGVAGGRVAVGVGRVRCRARREGGRAIPPRGVPGSEQAVLVRQVVEELVEVRCQSVGAWKRRWQQNSKSGSKTPAPLGGSWGRDTTSRHVDGARARWRVQCAHLYMCVCGWVGLSDECRSANPSSMKTFCISRNALLSGPTSCQREAMQLRRVRGLTCDRSVTV